MANGPFTGQVAIVTGAGQGIGFEIAWQLALQGAKVVLNDADPELSDKAVASITSEGGTAYSMPGDASDIAFIRSMVAEGVKQFGKVTLAVANAGLSLYGDFLEYPEEDFDRVMKLNLGGSFYLAQAVAKQIIAQKSGGSIVFISSVTGHQAHKNLGAYGVTKAGLEMLAKNLVIELSPYNISVNAVAPGATLTERTLSFAGYADTWSALTPLGRPATVQDIGNAVLFFLLPASRHITGQSLVVDGGWTSISPAPNDK
ncbi:3-oxoacyl-ACP reductase FabG [Mucilaginibacter gynuensis]|uniref:3-oxoacyl-ACP reductase FabG n=1 Tax=Mucilaginibacter gynuensis TaxID=1302236 RepID=A0ABP8FV72_9SPHI